MLHRKFILFSFFAGISLATHASNLDNEITTSVPLEEFVIEEKIPDDTPARETEVSPPLDLWDRIRRGFSMPALKNKNVTKQLNYYARNVDYIERATARSSKYLYYIVEEIEKREMPLELALLPFVESAFQPEARSYAKAAGLWQFIPSTGSIFNLQQNLWKDERRDILESTRAALDYLQKLYDKFGDWQLALASYNWGEGSVARAIQKNESLGRPCDYSHLKMPRETANYVPKLEAIKRIVADPEKYGVHLPEIENSPYFIKIVKERDIDVKIAAQLAEMPYDEFRQLNPSFNLPVIVANHNSLFLLPKDNLELFMDNLAISLSQGLVLSSWIPYHVSKNETLESIALQHNMTLEELLLENKIPKGRKVLPGSMLLVRSGEIPANLSEETLSARVALATPNQKMRRIVHRVRRGDTIHSIAKHYRVTQTSLRQTNHLRRNSHLKIGQRLIVSVPAKTVSHAKKLTANNYRVKTGDTVFSIARHHRVTIRQLKKLNRLKNYRIYVGQVLRLR